MIIAVIGDYESPTYKDMVQRVQILNPEEEVFDLSRHKTGGWKKMLESRFTDIRSAHRIAISYDWHNHLDAKRDITHAQLLNKECFIEREGQFRPFPEYAERK